MGQRTAIILKKTYKDRAIINVAHIQWGYGKVMPMLFLQELLRCAYPLNRHAYDKVCETHRPNYEGTEVVEPIDIDFTFEPLNSRSENYVSNEIVDGDLDVFSIPVVEHYFNMTDNNNGGMIVEVTQKYDEEGKPLMYGGLMDVKIGFVLGDEECSYYHDNLNESISIEEPFERILSAKEYMTRTLTSIDGTRTLREGDKKFIQYFNGLCNLFGVEQIEDKKKAREVKKRIELVHNTVQALTKDLSEGKRIDVPKELLEKEPLYV